MIITLFVNVAIPCIHHHCKSACKNVVFFCERIKFTCTVLHVHTGTNTTVRSQCTAEIPCEYYPVYLTILPCHLPGSCVYMCHQRGQMKSTWKCITLATVDYGAPIVVLLEPTFSSQWLYLSDSFTEQIRSLALTSLAISLLLNCTIDTGRPENLLHTRKASSISAIVRDLYLTHTHLGSRPFHQLPRPSPLQNLILLCMPPTW